MPLPRRPCPGRCRREIVAPVPPFELVVEFVAVDGIVKSRADHVLDARQDVGAFAARLAFVELDENAVRLSV